MSNLQSTFETRLELSEEDMATLLLQADYLSRLERELFVALVVKSVDRNLLKRQCIEQKGITARQFNALRINIEGKVKAWTEIEKNTVSTLIGKIKATERKIKTLQSDKAKVLSKALSKSKANSKHQNKTRAGVKQTVREQVQRINFVIHQKKRKLDLLKHRLGVHQARLRGTPSICFGSRDLFRKQFNLKANGYKTHSQWLEDWRFARANQFLNLGSTDETLGSQTCQYDPASGTMRIRLAQPCAGLNGGDKFVTVGGVNFKYGQDKIIDAQANKQAVATRIVFRKVKNKTIAYALLSVTEKAPDVITSKTNGALGVDLNSKSIAWAQIGPTGNLYHSDTLPCDLTGLSSEQAKQVLSLKVIELVNQAKSQSIPIVCERLDFTEKKKTLGETSAKYAHMLSGFAYSSFYSALKRRCAREGVELIEVNPAFTSVLGYIKFGHGRMTVDEAAAMAIARRGLRFKERLRTRSMSPALRTKLMKVSGEKHMRHVWAGWRRFYSVLGKTRRVWDSRCSSQEVVAGRSVRKCTGQAPSFKVGSVEQSRGKASKTKPASISRSYLDARASLSLRGKPFKLSWT